MTGASTQVILLQHVPCIQYPVQFQEDQDGIQALIISGSEVKVMTPAYIAKLGLVTRRTDVGT